MNKRTIYILLLLTSLGLMSCEKEIDIDLPPPIQGYVIDGMIESNSHPRITISRNIPYFEEINLNDIQTLADIFVTEAQVYVSDGIITDSLVFTIDQNYFPPVAFVGTNPLLKGEIGKTYYLTAIIGEDTLTSQTTIQALVPLDSIYWKPDGDKDSLGFGWGWINEPASQTNYYRLFCKRQGYPYYVDGGTLDDRLINGLSTSFTFRRPRPLPSYLSTDDDNLSTPSEERGYFKRGDTISVKFCTIDLPAYDFIRTYDAAGGSFGNPFSGPTFVKSNITGGFGGFVGYGVTNYTYIVPQ